jgi:hypothetical protein
VYNTFNRNRRASVYPGPKMKKKESSICRGKRRRRNKQEHTRWANTSKLSLENYVTKMRIENERHVERFAISFPYVSHHAEYDQN